VLDRQARRQVKVQLGVGFANGFFYFFGGISSCKQKAQIAGTFRPGDDVVVQARSDFERFNSRDASRFVRAFDFFQDSTLGDGNHHYAAGGSLAGPIATGQTKRVAQQQFFEADGLACRIRRKSQRSRTETTNGARRNFQRPDAIAIYAELCVDRALRKSERANRINCTTFYFALL
jgi:hypothetical protein